MMGLSNQFQILCHLLYLASRTRRIPVVQLLQPVHLSQWELRRWTDFFDMERMTRETGVPVLEWPDLKSAPPESTLPIEQLACWSTTESALGEHADPWILGEARVNVTFWPLPDHIRPIHTERVEAHLNFECVQES